MSAREELQSTSETHTSETSSGETTTRLSGLWEVGRRPLILAAVAALSLKLLWFAIDRAPLFYMGDSRSYVNSAIWGRPILDRSNSYGLLMWLISVRPGTLTTLVLVQTIAGAATAWILAFCLLRYFKVRPAIAVAAVVAFAVEPLQLLHERMVLTESFAMLMLAFYLLFCLSYLARPRALTLIVLAATGVLLLSLRLVYVPVTLFGAVLVPLLGWVFPRGEWAATNTVRRFLGHLAISLLVTLGLHQLYKTANGVKANRPPAYQYKSGLFLASAWAPLIEPEDALDPRARRVVEKLLNSSAYSLRDWGVRSVQLWAEGGFASEMKKAFGGDTDSANVAAQEISQRTLRRVPLSVVRLTARTYVDYWRSPARVRNQLLDEQGTLRGPEQKFLADLKRWFNLDARESAATMTPIKRYHLVGAPWYVVLSVSPLIGLLCMRWVRREARPGALLLAVFGAMLLIVPCATAAMLVRYLHPLVFGTLAALAVIADEATRRLMEYRSARIT